MSSQSVRDFMTSVPRCCTPQDSITDVARLMLECDCGAVPVVEELESRRLVGMVTDRDMSAGSSRRSWTRRGRWSSRQCPGRSPA
jgi:CBS domain-containing protein